MRKHSVRPQDKPQTKIRIAKRRARLVQLFAEGLSTRKAAKQLAKEGFKKCGPAIVARDLQAISRETPLEDARHEAHVTLRGLQQFVVDASDMKDTETVNSLLQIHDRLARLLGLDAPTKSVKAVITPEATGLYSRFLEATRHLNEEQIESVFAFAGTLTPVNTITVHPPDSSPLWEVDNEAD